MGADETRDEPDAGQDEPDADEAAAGEPDADESPWRAKTRQARALWDAGDNARLRSLLAELAAAPPEETEALEVARDLRRRLAPDPIAIALWVLSLAVFGLITYLFVIR